MDDNCHGGPSPCIPSVWIMLPKTLPSFIHVEHWFPSVSNVSNLVTWLFVCVFPRIEVIGEVSMWHSTSMLECLFGSPRKVLGVFSNGVWHLAAKSRSYTVVGTGFIGRPNKLCSHYSLAAKLPVVGRTYWSLFNPFWLMARIFPFLNQLLLFNFQQHYG